MRAFLFQGEHQAGHSDGGPAARRLRAKRLGCSGFRRSRLACFFRLLRNERMKAVGPALLSAMVVPALWSAIDGTFQAGK
jgi:hypothetical protein